MSSGGKGGSKTTEKALPDWLREPAQRNLQRAEAVQQIPYMPYYGADVAAFTPAQNAAFDANIGAAEAFGLLAPNTLTATSGMPTPTDWDGFSGYSSQPMYESALAELNAKQPGAVAQYNALFGGSVPTTGGGGGRFRGSAGGNITDHENRWKDKASHIMDTIDYERYAGEKEAQDDYNAAVLAGTNWDKPRDWNTLPDADKWTANAKDHADTQGTIMNWPQKPVSYPTLGQQQAIRNITPPSTAGQVPPWMQTTVKAPALDEQIYNYNQKKKVDKMIPNNAEKIFVVDSGGTIRDLGEPPNLDVRKNANPHANTKWSLGRW